MICIIKVIFITQTFDSIFIANQTEIILSNLNTHSFFQISYDNWNIDKFFFHWTEVTSPPECYSNATSPPVSKFASHVSPGMLFKRHFSPGMLLIKSLLPRNVIQKFTSPPECYSKIHISPVFRTFFRGVLFLVMKVYCFEKHTKILYRVRFFGFHPEKIWESRSFTKIVI